VAAFFTRLTTHNVKSQQGHVMKQRDCNFESMSTAELWDLYNELGSKLAVKLQAEATSLQQRLDEIQRRVFVQTARGKGKRKHAAVAKFRNRCPPFQTWSGRGSQPLWVRSVLEHGGTMDGLRIEAFVPPQNEKAHSA
jgi:DNA-binding protein H-NS